MLNAKMKIYCKNYNCPQNRKLDSPISIKFRKFYVPLGEEDNLCLGECQSDIFNLISAGISGIKVEYSVALCSCTEKDRESFVCDRKNCVNNCDKKCLRNEIIIDKLVVDKEIYWVCKNFAHSKISGHKDLMQLVDSDGHPKYGGHIDDNDAEKMYQDSLKFKSYPKGHKEAVEPKRRKM